MEWKHKTSLEWLKNRQQYLTASDIKTLIPFTSSGRKRKVTELDYLKVYAKKLTRLTDKDCWSYGAAARGHLLEPYAIASYNNTSKNLPPLYHWDDISISHDSHGLAYSPDALDITPEQMKKVLPQVLGEVKSYNAERHLITAMTPKEKLEERWQIATAMAVSSTIKKAYLILYNPDINVRFSQLYIIEFTREDLANEIEIISDIETKWLEFCGPGKLKSPTATVQYTSFVSSKTIEQEIEQYQKLNPM